MRVVEWQKKVMRWSIKEHWLADSNKGMWGETEKRRDEEREKERKRKEWEIGIGKWHRNDLINLWLDLIKFLKLFWIVY